MRPLLITAGRAQLAGSGRAMVCLCLAGLLASNLGCQSLGMGRQKRTARRSGEGPAGVAGPTERRLLADRWRREKAAGGQNPEMAAALTEYDAAEQLYQAGKFKESEAAFKSLAKSRRNTYESFRSRWDHWWGLNADDLDPYMNYGDPVEEDALFMVAESQFAQKRYSWAQDSYDTLLTKYPSTRHMEPSTRRLFRISMYWLGFSSDVGTDGDVQLAAHESIDPAKPPKAPQVPKIPVIPNVTDKTRPVFDTHGRALQALRSIWLHDAAGPLADDALMLSANHHLRTGDFVEATRMYKLLREQYPDSPHFQDAHMLGAYVTMASYEGATYDSKPLNEARQLKQTALQLFPNLSEEDRARLEKEVERMNAEEVGRLWDKVEFYQVKRQPKSVAIYCNLIINKYPDSKYAEKARAELAAIQQGLEGQQSKGKPRTTGVKLNPVPDGPDESPVELPGRIEIDEES